MIYRLYKDDYDRNYRCLKICKADFNDAENILALQKTAYASEAELINDFKIQPLTQTLEELADEFQEHLVLKAIILNTDRNEDSDPDSMNSGKIIGSVRAYSNGSTCYIGKLIVDPEYQKMGIGTELMNTIENHFNDANRFELYTGEKSSGNIRFYKNSGYSVFKSEPVSDKLTLMFLEKQQECRI